MLLARQFGDCLLDKACHIVTMCVHVLILILILNVFVRIFLSSNSISLLLSLLELAWSQEVLQLVRLLLVVNDTGEEGTVTNLVVVQNWRCLVGVVLGHILLIHVIVLSVLVHVVTLVIRCVASKTIITILTHTKTTIATHLILQRLDEILCKKILLSIKCCLRVPFHDSWLSNIL
jgi:hypothetical protein